MSLKRLRSISDHLDYVNQIDDVDPQKLLQNIQRNMLYLIEQSRKQEEKINFLIQKINELKDALKQPEETFSGQPSYIS
jgi:hypothetical protein